jgi:ABC-type transporter Mla subunit MlaD
MTNSIEIIPYILLLGWLIFSIFYLIRASKHPDKINPYIFESIPQVFPTIGILGTFLGIAYGLWNFDASTTEKMEQSIPNLIGGLKTAFLASIFGVGLLILFSKLTAIVQRKNDKGKQSDETIAINRLCSLVSELKDSLMSVVDDSGNKSSAGNLLRDIYEESKKQSQALQSFSTDLAIKVEAGFEKIISTPDHGVIAELQSVRTEIENLGSKLQDPTTEMTQNVVKSLQDSLGSMVEEFKTSMSGSTKSELENLTTLLSKAGGSLTDFPEKLQGMTDHLNQNFKGLQEVVQQIAKQTLTQSEESTGQMKIQVEQISKVLSENIGGLQRGQENLIDKQNENIQVSDLLLSSFNSSIEKMDGLSNGVSETMVKIKEVQKQFDNIATSFRIMTDNVNSSAKNFGEAQVRFSQHANLFLESNKQTIDEIQKSLTKAKETSADYAQKFGIIENGLTNIFDEIQEGIKEYSETVADKNSKLLNQFTLAMVNATETLAGAFKEHSERMEDIEEIVDQISKFRK